MSDNRSISGSIDVQQDGRHATAFKLMEKIGSQEYSEKKGEQGSRGYWLKLFVDCELATRGRVAESLK